MENNSAQVDLIIIIGSKENKDPFFINIRISSLFEWGYGIPEKNIQTLFFIKIH